MSAAENGQGAETATPADKIADACQWAIFGAHSEPRTAESFRVLTAALQAERESVAALKSERDEAMTLWRNAHSSICQIMKLIEASDDFSAEEVIDLCKKVTGKFAISAEWTASKAISELETELESLRETNGRLRAALVRRHAEQSYRADYVDDALALPPDSVASDFAALRSIIVASVEALGNGSKASQSSSLDFLRSVPNEVGIVVAALRADVDTLARWKTEMLTVQSWWAEIDKFIRAHPDTPLGCNVSDIALAWLKERDGLRSALEEFVENDQTSEANCSCHIAPPCNDCVENAGMREIVARAKVLLANPPGGQTGAKEGGK